MILIMYNCPSISADVKPEIWRAEVRDFSISDFGICGESECVLWGGGDCNQFPEDTEG